MIALFRFPTLEKTTGIEIRFDPHRTNTLQLALPSHVTRRRFEYQMQGSFGRYSSFGHAKTRPGGIWRDGFEELNLVSRRTIGFSLLASALRSFARAIFCS